MHICTSIYICCIEQAENRQHTAYTRNRELNAVTSLANNDRLWHIGSEIWHAIKEMVRCFLEIHKSHEPKLVSIHSDDVNVLLRWISHNHRIHIFYVPQRYSHLLMNPNWTTKRCIITGYHCHLVNITNTTTTIRLITNIEGSSHL